MGPVPYWLFNILISRLVFYKGVSVLTVKLHTVSNGNDDRRIASLKPNMVPHLVNCWNWTMYQTEIMLTSASKDRTL